MSTSTLVGLVLAGWIAQQPQAVTTAPAPAQTPAAQEQPLSTNLKVRLATSAYLDDGRVVTASASDWPLALNKTVVAFATSGKTMCDARAATQDQPSDFASGWRVQFTPTREGRGELVLQVGWRPLTPFRIADRSTADRRLVALTRPGTPESLQTLTLHPGDRIVVDYIGSRGPGFWVFRADGKSTVATPAREFKLRSSSRAAASGCNAVGMSLEIGLEPAKTDAMVEAELWLVRPTPDGSERSERQVLRLPLGQPASSYYFDEGRLAGPLPKPVQIFAIVSGELSAASIGADGKIHLNFRLARRYEPAPRGNESAATVDTTYRDLLAMPGEVLAFQLPTMSPLPPLSVRLRTQLVK